MIRQEADYRWGCTVGSMRIVPWTKCPPHGLLISEGLSFQDRGIVYDNRRMR